MFKEAMLNSTTHMYIPLSVNVRGDIDKVSAVVLPIAIIAVSCTLTLPSSSILIQMTLGCCDKGTAITTVQVKEKF